MSNCGTHTFSQKLQLREKVPNIRCSAWHSLTRVIEPTPPRQRRKSAVAKAKGLSVFYALALLLILFSADLASASNDNGIHLRRLHP